MGAITSVQSQTFLRVSAWAFLFGWGLHVIDHLRRGMSASPMFVMVGGMVQGIVVAVAIAMALRGHPRAPEAAIFSGVGSALVFTYAHLLPNFWPGYQDSDDLVAILQLHRRIRLHVVVPRRVRRVAALRCDHGVAAVLFDAHQRGLSPA